MSDEELKAASRQHIIEYFGNQGCLINIKDSTSYEILEKSPTQCFLKKIDPNHTRIGTILLNRNQNLIAINIERKNFYEKVIAAEKILEALCPAYKININLTPIE